MERDLYKQIKLAKTLEIKLKTEKNFRAEKKNKKQNKTKKKTEKEKRKTAINQLNFIFITLHTKIR